MGHMKTPYTYEYIKVSENDLIAPERSVFIGNFAPNREIGIMAHGQVLDKRLEYALGLFNGPRRSFQDFNNGKDLFTFINYQTLPAGRRRLAQTAQYRRIVELGQATSTAAAFGSDHGQRPVVHCHRHGRLPGVFVIWKNVYENGERMQWSGDLTYYYKSLGILAGYQGGFQDYSIQTGTRCRGRPPTPTPRAAFVGVTGTKPVRVPMTGYNVTLFCFLTGEQITRRVELLEPRKEYEPKKFLEGNIGAVESFNRVRVHRSGEQRVHGGPGRSPVNTARAIVLDNGFNWYPNHYTKLTFDWQYCTWATPVFLSPGHVTSFTNLFWFRTQVFF